MENQRSTKKSLPLIAGISSVVRSRSRLIYILQTLGEMRQRNFTRLQTEIANGILNIIKS